jgi:hypothetical protein
VAVSLAGPGVDRPDPEIVTHDYTPRTEFPPWMDLGKVYGEGIFYRYLMELYFLWKSRKPDQIPNVYFLCNACHIDVDFRFADTGLLNIMYVAIKKNESHLTLNSDQLVGFQTYLLVESLPQEHRADFQQLIRLDISSQLELLNQILGANWKIIKDDPAVREIVLENQSFF